jgi:16S rRNA (cytidine1402-2'-O)-methyltransferase
VSDKKTQTGRLTLAGTHLGEPQDLPLRSLAALREAELLVFEEDRPARSFLKAAGVHRDYLKLSEHMEKDTLAEVDAALKAGKWVCYMSDQGMPGVSDPGRALVELAFRTGAQVQVIPGPSSITAAVAACPFDCSAFHFLGFLPREEQHRAGALKSAAAWRRPLVIMDTPYRLKHLLQTCDAVFGKGAGGRARRGFLAVDVSGPAEDYWLGTFADLGARAGRLEGKLNFVLIVEGDGP